MAVGRLKAVAWLMGMKQILVMMMALAGCGKKHDGNTGVVNPNESSPKVVPANIADPILEKAIRKRLKKPKGELTKADMEKVIYLNLSDNKLTDVKGLESVLQFKALFLNENKLTKLTGVKGLDNLTQLEHLELSDNQLTDVKGLEKLTQLTRLHLNNNQLTDVKGLENLTQLTQLNLQDNPDLTKAQIDELQKALPNCAIAGP